MRYCQNSNGLPGQKGFSLIEVLVSSVITSSGLAALAALLLATLSGTADALHRTQAGMLADALVAQLLIAPDVDPVAINSLSTTYECSKLDGCSALQFAGSGIHYLQDQVSDLLPDGVAVVCRDSSPHDGIAATPACDQSGSIVVKVFWSSMRNHDARLLRPVP